MKLEPEEEGLTCEFCGAQALLYGQDINGGHLTSLGMPWCTEKCEESADWNWESDE